MAKKMTVEEVRAKVRWEGGLRATIEYGLKATDIADPALAAAWRAACALYNPKADRWAGDPGDLVNKLDRLLHA